MATLIDLKDRPRHPEKRRRPETPLLRKPDWIRVKAPGRPGLSARREDRARARAAHGLRGGRLPQYRRVLVEEARHHDDHGRHLHARLRLLQRQDRACRARSMRTSRGASRKRWRSSGSRTSSSPRSTATTWPMAARRISRPSSARSAQPRPATTIEVLTPDFLRKDGALEIVDRGPARRLQPQSGDRALALSDHPPGRALLPLAPAAGARQGARPADVHEIGHHGGPRRRAERGAAGDGRSALGRRRFPDHRPVSAAHAAATPRSTAS